MPSNKSNKRCASFSGNGFAVKDGQDWRDEPQASQVIKSAGCAKPHGGNRDCETACQHASAQCVSSLGDRCELKGHIWPVNFSQEEGSGCQPGLDTYRCLIRCHPQRRGQQCCHRILSRLQIFSSQIRERICSGRCGSLFPERSCEAINIILRKSLWD